LQSYHVPEQRVPFLCASANAIRKLPLDFTCDLALAFAAATRYLLWGTTPGPTRRLLATLRMTTAIVAVDLSRGLSNADCVCPETRTAEVNHRLLRIFSVSKLDKSKAAWQAAVATESDFCDRTGMSFEVLLQHLFRESAVKLANVYGPSSRLVFWSVFHFWACQDSSSRLTNR
jgi:hypothetical protein